MSKSKKETIEPQAAETLRYETGRLLKSKALAGYQPDFARAVLTEPFYTIKEACAALDAALKKGVK